MNTLLFQRVAWMLMRMNAKHILKTVCSKDIYSSRWIGIHEPTREHIVPQSFLPSTALKNDLNNIFICTKRVNSLRGRLPFSVIPLSEPNKIVIDGKTGIKTNWDGEFSGPDICIKTKRTFMPPIQSRGSIARACLYMGYQYPQVYRRIFDNVIDINTAYEWHVLYPVEEWEILRSLHIHRLGFPINPLTTKKI